MAAARVSGEGRTIALAMSCQAVKRMMAVQPPATIGFMSSHVEHATPSSRLSRPTPKHRKINQRSVFMPSTTLPIEPSLPRRALPLPQTDTKVMRLTTKTFALMLMVENTCSRPLGIGWNSGF